MAEKPAAAEVVTIAGPLAERVRAAFGKVADDWSGLDEFLLDVLDRGLAPYEQIELEDGVVLQADGDLPDDCIMIEMGTRSVLLSDVRQTENGLLAIDVETGQEYHVQSDPDGTMTLRTVDDSDMP